MTVGGHPLVSASWRELGLGSQGKPEVVVAFALMSGSAVVSLEVAAAGLAVADSATIYHTNRNGFP